MLCTILHNNAQPAISSARPPKAPPTPGLRACPETVRHAEMHNYAQPTPRCDPPVSQFQRITGGRHPNTWNLHKSAQRPRPARARPPRDLPARSAATEMCTAMHKNAQQHCRAPGVGLPVACGAAPPTRVAPPRPEAPIYLQKDQYSPLSLPGLNHKACK